MLIVLGLVASALLVTPSAPTGAEPPRALLLPPTTVSVGLAGTRTVVRNTAVTASGVVKAPAGGVLAQASGLVVSLVQAVLHPLAGAGGARVALQLRTPAGWSTFRTTRADSSGGYAFTVPTYSYGTQTWRVSTSGTMTSAATVTAPFAVAVATPQRLRGRASSYRLLTAAAARWNPCAPVPYYVNPAGMPRGALRTVARAMGRVQAATGLVFRYAGVSRGVPFASGTTTKGMPAYGFTIAWAAPRTVRRLRGSTVAISGSWSQGVSLGAGRVAHRYVGGGLVIDRTERLRPGFGRGRSLGYVLLHEMGHVVGLDHTSDTTQVMASRVTSRSVAQFGAGDLAGFARVGLRGGCL